MPPASTTRRSTSNLAEAPSQVCKLNHGVQCPRARSVRQSSRRPWVDDELARVKSMRRRTVLWWAAASLLGAGPAGRAAAGTTSAEASMAGGRTEEGGAACIALQRVECRGHRTAWRIFRRRKARGRPLLVRIDSTVDFDRTLEWPARRSGPHPRSAHMDRAGSRRRSPARYRFH